MQKKHSSKYSFQNRKRHYQSRSRSGGLNFAFLSRLMDAFSGNKLKFITILTAAVCVIAVVLVLLLSGPIETSAQNSGVEGTTAGNSPAPVDTKADNYNQVDTQKVDEATLAGLTGEGLANENTGDVFGR